MTGLPAEQSTSKPAVLFFLLCLFAIIVPFMADSYTPSLPAIAHHFNGKVSEVQLTITLYLLGVALSQLIYGPLSDIFGRRPIILIGLAITLLGSLICSVAQSISMILIGRLITGMGAGASVALSRAIMRDCYAGASMARVGSYTGIFYTLAFALAPALGGLIQGKFGWRMNFIVIAFVIAGTLFITLRYLPETHLLPHHTTRQIKVIIKQYFMLLTSPVFLGYVLLTSVAYSGFIAYYTAAPFLFITELQLTPEHFGFLSLAIAIGLFLGMYINARLVIVIGINIMLWIGLVAMTMSGLWMLSLAYLGHITVAAVLLPVVLFSTASGFLFSNAMTHALHPFGHIAGIAGGLYGCLQVLTGSATSLLLSHFHQNTQLPLAIIFTSLGVIGLVVNMGLMYYSHQN